MTEAKKAGRDTDELNEDTGDVLARQARPELRRSLTRGEFSTVLQRISALQEESAGDNSDHRGQGVSMDAILAGQEAIPLHGARFDLAVDGRFRVQAGGRPSGCSAGGLPWRGARAGGPR